MTAPVPPAAAGSPAPPERAGSPLESDPSVQLMRRIAAGDEKALAALYERWAAPLLSFLERMTKDRATAEDVLQDVFLRVWRAAPRYEPTAKFSTWLFQVARNAWLNEREKLLRRPRSLDGDLLSSGGGDGDDGAAEPEDPNAIQPDLAVSDRELAGLIQAAVDRLPEKFREVWTLGAAQGLPYPEVAQILGVPVGTVKSRMFQAVRLLRSDLEKYAP